MIAIHAAIVAILGAASSSLSLAATGSDCAARPPSVEQSSGAVSEHVLLQFTGQLTRLALPAQYDPWDSGVMPEDQYGIAQEDASLVAAPSLAADSVADLDTLADQLEKQVASLKLKRSSDLAPAALDATIISTNDQLSAHPADKGLEPEKAWDATRLKEDALSAPLDALHQREGTVPEEVAAVPTSRLQNAAAKRDDVRVPIDGLRQEEVSMREQAWSEPTSRLQNATVAEDIFPVHIEGMQRHQNLMQDGAWQAPASSRQDQIMQHDRAALLSLGAVDALVHQPRDANTSCGFVVPGGQKKPVCGKMVFQTCQNPSMVTAESCPTSCNYVLPDPLFTCGAACVAKEDCSLGGHAMGFYDDETKQCGPGPIEGCLRYDGPTSCSTCGKLFKRAAGGKDCVFLPGYKQFAVGVLLIVVVLLCIIVPLNVYRWCCKDVGNEAALSFGWRHRLRVQASKNLYADPTQMPEKFSLSTNMHTELVAGTGLCLFYNSLFFLFIVCLLVAIAATFVWGVTVFPDMGYEGKCLLSNRDEYLQATQDLLEYQEVCAITYGILWMVLFFVSLFHARAQHIAARKLDQRTSLMADFAIGVTGLPRDATEREVAAFFEDISPGVIEGVSLAYDYTRCTPLIQRLLERQVQTEENRIASFGFKAFKAAMGQSDPEELNGTQTDERDLAISTLQRLQGSGTAFVVCSSEWNKKLLWNQWSQDGKPRFREEAPLSLHEPLGEPTCYFWENFGFSKMDQLFRSIVEVCIIIIQMAVLGLVVYWPAAYYTFYRLQATGADSADADPVVMLLGYGIAIMNAIMYFLVDVSSRRVGFHHKVDVDICNLIGCTTIVGGQTLFNMAVAHFAVATVDVSMSKSLFASQSDDDHFVRQASIHVFMAAKLWNLLVPGFLILPDLLGRLFKYVLSFKAMYEYWVYIPIIKSDLRTDEEVTRHEAEDRLLPGPMQAEFDYSNGICITCAAFLMLFFPSSYSPLTCWILLGWVLMSYVTLKYCHLRFNMVIEYTTSLLDDCFTYMWGIPLSIIAAASAYWAADTQLAGPWSLSWPTAFVLSLLLYLIAVHLVLQGVSTHTDIGKGDYANAREILRYDYFNTNPIQVLKSRYLKDGKPLTYFARGKEYLQQTQSWFPGAQYSPSKLFNSYEQDDDSDMETCGPVGCLSLPASIKSKDSRKRKY